MILPHIEVKIELLAAGLLADILSGMNETCTCGVDLLVSRSSWSCVRRPSTVMRHFLSCASFPWHTIYRLATGYLLHRYTLYTSSWALEAPMGTVQLIDTDAYVRWREKKNDQVPCWHCSMSCAPRFWGRQGKVRIFHHPKS